jgi:proline iminopeptidase
MFEWQKMFGFIAILLMIIISPVFAKAAPLIIKEGMVNIDGGRIWYKIVSSEQTKYNTPLLLLHGGPGVPHDYLHVLEKIAVDRPVIFYDQLGCGHSSVINGAKTLWNINRYERELEALVAHLHLNKFHLFGHSWGGALAIEYGLKHPESLKSMVLASPLLSTQLWVEHSKQLISQLPPGIQQTIFKNEQQRTTDSKAYLNAVDIYYHHFVCRLHEWPSDLNYSFEHLNDDIYKTMWGPSEFTMTGNLKHFDRMHDLKNLNIPVFITGGKYDEAGSATLAFAEKQLPQGKLIIYEKSAHMAFIEEEKRYLGDLRLFLKASEKKSR